MEQEEITTEEETYVDEGSVVTVVRVFTKEKGGYQGLIAYLYSLMETKNKGETK